MITKSPTPSWQLLIECHQQIKSTTSNNIATIKHLNEPLLFPSNQPHYVSIVSPAPAQPEPSPAMMKPTTKQSQQPQLQQQQQQQQQEQYEQQLTGFWNVFLLTIVPVMSHLKYSWILNDKHVTIRNTWLIKRATSARATSLFKQNNYKHISNGSRC